MLKKDLNYQKEKGICNCSQRVGMPDIIEDRLREILRAQNNSKTKEINKQSTNSFLPPEKLQKSISILAESLKEYTEQVDEFYTRTKDHTGEGYKMIARVLESFRDYKWIQRNRSFRFGPTPLGSDVSLEQIPIGKGRNHLVAHLLDEDGNPIKDLTLDEIKRELERRGSISKTDNDQIAATQADLYYMLCIADETDWSARALNAYINSYKPKLEVAIVLMIELLVEDMEAKTSTTTIQKYGKLIRHVYMDEESDGKEKRQLAAELGYTSLRTFYSHKDAAISFLAKFIFGISPGEYGLANIVLKDGRYVFVDLENDSKER